MGRWTAVDPAMEFIDAYRYSTNPIAFIDMQGLAEKVAIISSRAFPPQVTNSKQLDQFKTDFKANGSSFEWQFNLSPLELEFVARDNPDLKDLYILAHGDVTGDPGLIDDNGEYMNASTIQTSIGKKDVTIHIYACSQKGSKWPKNFKTEGSGAIGIKAGQLLKNLFNDLSAALKSLTTQPKTESSKIQTTRAKVANTETK